MLRQLSPGSADSVLAAAFAHMTRGFVLDKAEVLVEHNPFLA